MFMWSSKWVSHKKSEKTFSTYLLLDNHFSKNKKAILIKKTQKECYEPHIHFTLKNFKIIILKKKLGKVGFEPTTFGVIAPTLYHWTTSPVLQN